MGALVVALALALAKDGKSVDLGAYAVENICSWLATLSMSQNVYCKNSVS